MDAPFLGRREIGLVALRHPPTTTPDDRLTPGQVSVDTVKQNPGLVAQLSSPFGP